MKKKGMYGIQNIVVDMFPLSRCGLAVYRGLAYLVDEETQTTCATIKEISAKSSYAPRSVSTALRELEKLLLVEIIPHGSPENRRASQYRLLCPHHAIKELEGTGIFKTQAAEEEKAPKTRKSPASRNRP